MSNVLHLNTGWTTMAQLAKKHGVSERTGWNWLKAGKVEKRETEDGCSYRVMKPNFSGNPATVEGGQLTEILARLEKLERQNAELLARIVELESIHAERAARRSAIKSMVDALR